MVKGSSRKIRKVKAFNMERFIRLAKDLMKAVKKEEEKYGPVAPTS